MSLSDTAAERLGKHKKKGLSLWGLTSLSNAAAQSLAAHQGDLGLELDEFPESAAEILRQHPSFQDDE